MTDTIDASVAVKWFKENEKNSKEALELFRQIRDFEIKAVMNEWIILEVTRAFTKSKYPEKKIHEIQHILESLLDIGAVKRINVSDVLSQAMAIEIDLGLYAADSVHLATAVVSHSETLWTDDSHLLSPKVKAYCKKHNIEVKTLDEIEFNEE